MSHAMALREPLDRLAAVLCEHAAKLTAAAVSLIGSGLLFAPKPLAMAAIAAGATLAALAGIGRSATLILNARRRRSLRNVAALVGDDPSPCVVTDAEGVYLFLNAAARERFRSAEGGLHTRALADLFADPAAVLARFRDKAEALGAVCEDVVTGRGHVRITVICLGETGLLWRFEEIAGSPIVARGADSQALPMLVALESGAIASMNEAMRQLVGRRVAYLDRIITDLPLRSGDVHEVCAAEGARQVRVAEVFADGGKREVYFLPVGDRDPHASKPGGMSGIEELPVGLLELRADGVITSANRLARELLRPEGDVVGVSLADRLEGLGRPVRDWLEEAAKGRGLGRPEVLRVRSTEVEAFLQVTLGRAAGRGVVRLVAVLNDATELKTLEAQFVQSQKMQAIGQLAGGVAHDFNNLLTAISGHCDLMLLRHDQGDPDYADLVQIHQNANRAAALVGQLLAFSRKQTLQPQVIDLRDILSDLTHLLNRLVGERIALVLEHEPGLPPIRADRRQLEQVIMNLVVNARDAMPEGGAIRIGTATRVLSDDLHRDRAKVPAGRYVVVKVEDHGIGIPADKISKIFEPFFTTKRTGEGTGLGLSTAYGIVKQSGGFIFVDSVIGTGTVFTLYFPAYDGQVDLAVPTAGAPVGQRERSEAAAGEARRSIWHQGPSQPARRKGLGGAKGAAAEQGPASANTNEVGDAATRMEDADAGTTARSIRAGILEESMTGPASASVSDAREAVGPGLRTQDFAASAERARANDANPEPDPGGDGFKDAAAPPADEARQARTSEPALSPPVGVHGASGDTAGDDADARPGRGAASDQGEGVILLVEDEAPVRAFASRALRMRGYTVIEAESAEEALSTLDDPDLRVDLFVTDVIMPGLDGPTWVRKALVSRPNVKVIFVSGYAEDSFGEEQARIPNSVFLPKPFSLSELTATVQDQLY